MGVSLIQAASPFPKPGQRRTHPLPGHLARRREAIRSSSTRSPRVSADRLATPRPAIANRLSQACEETLHRRRQLLRLARDDAQVGHRDRQLHRQDPEHAVVRIVLRHVAAEPPRSCRWLRAARWWPGSTRSRRCRAASSGSRAAAPARRAGASGCPTDAGSRSSVDQVGQRRRLARRTAGGRAARPRSSARPSRAARPPGRCSRTGRAGGRAPRRGRRGSGAGISRSLVSTRIESRTRGLAALKRRALR